MKKIVETTTHVTHNAWWLHVLWVLGGAVLGMAVAAEFAGIFRLPRNVYLVPYTLLAGAYLFAYTRWSELDLSEFIRHHWVSGVSAGAICWFEHGLTDSFADGPRPLECLGFLPGSCCPHYDGEPQRRPACALQG